MLGLLWLWICDYLQVLNLVAILIEVQNLDETLSMRPFAFLHVQTCDLKAMEAVWQLSREEPSLVAAHSHVDVVSERLY